MGFPLLDINNFTVFKALSDGEINPLYGKVKSAFKQYKLFVFILHNPNTDPEFDYNLNNIFPELDNITGDNVLFFSIFNKTKSRISEFIKSKYFGFRELSDEAKEFYRNQYNYNVKDTNTSVYFLSKLLNIEIDKLPILILSNNLQSREMTCIRTTKQSIIQQFSYLSNYARECDNLNIKDLNFKELAKENVFKITLKESFTKRLSFFYSTATVIDFDNLKTENESTANTNSELDKINREISDHKKSLLNSELLEKDDYLLKKETDVFNEVLYDKNLIYLSGISLKSIIVDRSFDSLSIKNKISEGKYSCLTPDDIKHLDSPALLRRSLSVEDISCFESKSEIHNSKREFTNSSLAPSIEPNYYSKIKLIYIDYLYIENESRIILKTVNSISDTYKRKEAKRKNHDEDLDYSPLIISLSKLFEIEINLSVVHWIRKKLRIHLPDYFNKYEPEVEAFLQIKNQHDSFYVNFNKNGKGKWIPPGLGQSEYSFKILNKRFRWDNFKNNYGINSKILLNNWEALRIIRNKAAHTEITDGNDFILFQNSLLLLNHHRIFNKFYHMKKEFRGESN